MKKELKIPRIKDGTVIDHITAGQALKVLRILGIPEGTKSIVSVAMYVKSKKMGKKDIVKVENRELDPEEVNKIALIAPKATINIIRDYKVAKKFRVHVPDEIVGIVRCPNPNCISNSEEPIESRFVVVRRDPLVIKCYYCERKPDNIADNII
ncbi:MAG: aspartate carbamoyltransferase regulatory subunit [Thermoplasmata archaeon]|nr:aspartate carbamoyltransferase regulatory subunit [Thermoplasmata archaeon]